MKNTFILLTFFFLLSSCTEKKEEVKELIRPVRYAEVSQSGGEKTYTFSGVAQSSEETNLSFRVAGNVRTLNVKLGDRVKKGQLIATIDPSDYSIQVDQAVASEKGTEANVKSSEAQVSSSEAQVKNAEMQLITARSSFQRIENLYENNSIPLSEYEQAKANFESAETQYEAAKFSLSASKAGYDAAKTQVTSASKQTQSARNQVSYTKLVAPFNGVITAVNVEANELVAAGTSIAVLSSERKPEITVGVPEVFINKIKKGQKVSIDFSVLEGKPFNGTVEEMAYAAGNSPTYPIIIRIGNPTKDIHPGMAANVTFQFGNAKAKSNALVIPVKSVGENDKGNFVFLIDESDGKTVVKKQIITVGKLTSEGFEIKEGLSAGQKIAVAGLQTLLEGQEVKLLQ
jgi:multidrug efflux system membrane fusion protein